MFSVIRAGDHPGDDTYKEVYWQGQSNYRTKDDFGIITARIDLGIPDFKYKGIYVMMKSSLEGVEVWGRVNNVDREDRF